MDKETEITVSDSASKEVAVEHTEALPELLETTKFANEDKDADGTKPEAAEPPKRKRGRPRKNPPKETEKTSEDAAGSAADIAPAAEASENVATDSASTDEAAADSENNGESANEENASIATDGEPASEDNESDTTSAEPTGDVDTCDDSGVGEADTAHGEDITDEAATDEDALPRNSDGEFIIPTPDEGELFPLFTPEEIIDTEPLEGVADERTEEDDASEPDEGENENGVIAPEEVKEAPPKRVKRKRPEREIGSRGIDTLFDFLELFIFTFVAVLLVTTFLFRHSVVSGDSMMNTLHDEDKLIISDLFYTPDYGDIVVVEDHTAGITSPIVKRVIALEGDTVRVTYDAIWVNGEPLDESEYVFTDGIQYFYDLSDHIYFKDYESYAFIPAEYYEFRVPADEIYVLGDHRNDSTDSRKRGTVREDSVLGRVIVRFYPFDDFKFFG